MVLGPLSAKLLKNRTLKILRVGSAMEGKHNHKDNPNSPQ